VNYKAEAKGKKCIKSSYW